MFGNIERKRVLVGTGERLAAAQDFRLQKSVVFYVLESVYLVRGDQKYQNVFAVAQLFPDGKGIGAKSIFRRAGGPREEERAVEIALIAIRRGDVQLVIALLRLMEFQ